MDIYVECPICHNKYKSITNNHLIKKHGINIEKFRDMYPDYNVDSKYTQFKKKEANREIASRESVREKEKKML